MNRLTAIAGLQVVHLQHGQAQTRIGARAEIRLALRQMVAAARQLDVERIAIEAAAGSAPRLLVDGRPDAAGISLAHDGWISIAAYYVHGPVGIDVMQVQATHDWYNVARDYLGPRALDLLARSSDAERAQAFAQAWSGHEAHLKCLGLGLSEWSELPAIARLQQVAVPPGYVAMVALANS